MYWWLKLTYERGVTKFAGTVLDEDKHQVEYELSGTRYQQTDRADRIEIIPKDEIKSILGCSPNHADSMALLTRSVYEYYPDIFTDSL